MTPPPFTLSLPKGVLLLSLLLLAGCDRCGGGKAAPPPDAAVAPATARYGTDVKSALFMLYPEFRGTQLERGHATVIRRVRWSAPDGGSLAAALRPSMQDKGLEPADAGESFLLAATRRPFLVTAAELPGGELELKVSLPLGNDDVGRLLQATAPMSSEQLAGWLPDLPGAALLDERFVLGLTYTSKPSRVDFLVRQLTTLLTAGEWRLDGPLPPGWWDLDGGEGMVPGELALRFQREQARTSISLQRKDDRVQLELVQPISSP